MISDKQSETLDGIETLMYDSGRSPMAAELGEHLGVERTVLARRLERLARAGYLQPRSNRHLPLELTQTGLRAVGAIVPILGSIRGGPLSEALEEPSGYLRLPRAHRDARRQFALRVSGDSMSDTICPDDVVLLEFADRRDPRQGEIVAVQVGSEYETTLKYFHSEGEQVTLRAENPRYQPIVVPANELSLLGYFVGRMSPSIAALFLST